MIFMIVIGYTLPQLHWMYVNELASRALAIFDMKKLQPMVAKKTAEVEILHRKAIGRSFLHEKHIAFRLS